MDNLTRRFDKFNWDGTNKFIMGVSGRQSKWSSSSASMYWVVLF